jgi:signal peptidase I
MSNLKADLERIGEVGVEGIALIPLRDPEARRRKRSRHLVAAVAVGCVVVAAVVIAVAVRSPDAPQPTLRGGSELVADSSYEEPSASMSPTLQVGDVVSTATSFSVIERGDVVRFRLPTETKSTSTVPMVGDGTNLKRVVGLPGDAIEGRGGAVFVNGHELSEPYVVGITSDFSRVVVPPDSYYVLGDNRESSKDSRYYGPIHRSEIIAIALRITAPASRAGNIAGSPR